MKLRTQIRNTLDVFFPTAMRFWRQRRAERSAQNFRSTGTGYELAAPELYVSADWEKDEKRQISDMLSTCDVFVDIGANVGVYTIMAGRAGKHVVAIEPNSNNLLSLYSNLAHNNLKDVEVFPIGLSDKPGILKVYNTGSMSSFVKGWGKAVESFSSSVPVSTLDIVLGRRFSSQRLAIKMDVEGFEYNVLKGAKQTLELPIPPIWLIENFLKSRSHPDGQNPHFKTIFEFFWAAGYKAMLVEEVLKPVSVENVNQWIADNRDMFSSNFVFSKT